MCGTERASPSSFVTTKVSPERTNSSASPRTLRGPTEEVCSAKTRVHSRGRATPATPLTQRPAPALNQPGSSFFRVYPCGAGMGHLDRAQEQGNGQCDADRDDAKLQRKLRHPLKHPGPAKPAQNGAYTEEKSIQPVDLG